MFSNRQFWDELAVQSYKAILKERPSSPLVHKNLGLAYVRMGKFNKAVRSFQRAVKCDKDFAEVYYHMGSTLQKMGKRKEAIRAFNNYGKYADNRDKLSGVVPDIIDRLREEESYS